MSVSPHNNFMPGKHSTCRIKPCAADENIASSSIWLFLISPISQTCSFIQLTSLPYYCLCFYILETYSYTQYKISIIPCIPPECSLMHYCVSFDNNSKISNLRFRCNACAEQAFVSGSIYYTGYFYTLV